jgi:hypothetical protein
MTNQEFSDQFDTLISAYYNTPEFGNIDSLAFDEYEKSVFLTRAQEEIVLELYNGKNVFNESFEDTEEIRRLLSSLIKTYSSNSPLTSQEPISTYSIFFEIPGDVWFITYESAKFKDNRLGCLDGGEAIVVPVSQDAFHKTKDNPFRGPNKTRVLRLDNNGNKVELVSKYNLESYLMRYVSKPNPIILIDLPDGLEIDNTSTKTECELHPALHKIILERATRAALQSKMIYAGTK